MDFEPTLIVNIHTYLKSAEAKLERFLLTLNQNTSEYAKGKACMRRDKETKRNKSTSQ